MDHDDDATLVYFVMAVRGFGRISPGAAVAGLTGSLVSILWHPGVNSMGASGAIFGVLGAIVAYLMRHGSVVPRALYLRHLHLAIAFIVYTLPSSFRHHASTTGPTLVACSAASCSGCCLHRCPMNRPKRATNAQ